MVVTVSSSNEESRRPVKGPIPLDSNRPSTAPEATTHKNYHEQDVVRAILADAPPSRPVLDLTDYMAKLEVAQIMQLCKNARHCTSLVVRYWCPVRILDLRALAIPLGPNLTTVDIGHSTIEDHQLAILSTHLSSIRVLVLSDCHAISSKGIRPLVQACHATLTSLTLSRSRLINSDALLWIGGTLAHGAFALRRLQQLDLTDCDAVGDDGLDGLARGCRALAFLNCSGCTRITHAGLKAFHALRVLRLQGCPGITDRALMEVAATCHDLRSLNVARCNNLSDQGVSALGRGCPRLQCLNVAGARAVSEGGLCVLAQGCPGLQVLNITGCTKITKNGLHALIEGLKYVRLAASFTGFVPRETATMEKLDDVQYYLEETAAIRLQNGLMKRYNKRWGRGYLFRLRLSAAATIIQSAFRHHVKRMMWQRADELRKREKACVEMQRLFRGYIVRKLAAKELKGRRELARMGRFAVVIQTGYRGYIVRSRKRARIIKAVNDLYVEREQEILCAAAVYIQAICRSRLARTRANALADIRSQRRLDMRVSALPIQCAYRCYRARVRLADLRRKKKLKEILEDHSARVIQKGWWSFKGMLFELKAARAAAALIEAQRKAATFMQATFRGFAARKTTRLDVLQVALENKAAIIIQKVFRSSRVMRWPDMRMNLIASRIWDMNDMEVEIAAQRTKDLRPRLLASLRVEEASSDSVDDGDDEEQLWEEVWDEARQCYYWYHPGLNQASDQLPLSKHALAASLVGKQVRIFWPAEDQWFPGTLLRYNKSKRKHKIAYDDGDEEWMNLEAEAARVQVLENDVWVMLGMYEPPEVQADKQQKRSKKDVERKLAKMRAEEEEWAALAEEEEEDETAEDKSEAGDEVSAATGSTTRASSSVKQTRMINTRTGEVRFRAKNARDWELVVDDDGAVCYVNRRTKERSYENPKLEKTRRLTQLEVEEKKQGLMDELHLAAYILGNLLEEDAAAQSEKAKKAVYKKMDHDMHMRRRLAGAMAALRDLIGVRNCERDEYYVYCQELLTQVDALVAEKDAAMENYRRVRVQLLDVVKADENVVCQSCSHTVPRTNKYCPVCGVKLVSGGGGGATRAAAGEPSGT